MRSVRRGDAGVVDVRVTLPPDPRSVAEARHLVHRSLLDWQLGPLADLAELLVSELVTNAVLHARTDVEIAVTAEGDRLHVEVCDGSPLLPRLRVHSLTATTGRGVRLLETLASGWGVVVTKTGKCVWFALDRQGGRSGIDSAEAWVELDVDSIDPI